MEDANAKLEALMTLLKEVKGWKSDKLSKAKKPAVALEVEAEGPEEELQDNQDEDTGEDGGPIAEILKRMKAASR